MPVLRSALPAVFATVEHRAWALALQRFLDGSAAYAPPLLPTQCRFGQWLYGNGRRLYASEASFNAVEGVHRRLHDVAGELVTLCNDGKREYARARMYELDKLRESLLAETRRLLDSDDAVDSTMS